MKAHFEQVRPLPENSFRAFLHEVEEFDAPWHYHPEYELTLILASQGIRYVGNSMESFSEGDLVLLGPNLPHCWKNSGNLKPSQDLKSPKDLKNPGNGQSPLDLKNPGNGKDPQGRKKTKEESAARAVVIQWPAQFLGKGWAGNPEFSHIRRLLQFSGRGIRFQGNTCHRAREMMLQLLLEPPFRKLMQLLEILDLLAGSGEGQLLCEEGISYPLNLEDNERINTVYNFVRQHYGEKITLAAVAGLVHMKAGSFSRFFSRIMRKPFFAFLNEYRVTMACKLLTETDMQVARIGFACGYESLPFFYRQFARYCGMPPQSYRKRFRSAAAPE